MSTRIPRIRRSRSSQPRYPAVPADFELVFKEVFDVVAPVWPLKDYVAVNPYFGLSGRSLLSARNFLRVFSDCELLMPLAHYAQLWRREQLSRADLQAAVAELEWPNSLAAITVDEIIERLEDRYQSRPSEAKTRRIRPVQTIAELANDGHVVWTEVIRDEVSKHSAAFYDQGQASWCNPWQHLSLYEAWRATARIDRNLETFGLAGVRQLVAQLPHTPQAALVALLTRMQVPYALWSTVLLSQAFSIPGWCAWAKYQDEQAAHAGHEPQALMGLLAMRLTYDVALSEALRLEVNWSSYLHHDQASYFACEHFASREQWIRYALLRATEVRHRRQLLSSLQLSTTQSTSATRPQSQLVFCIDVRSERMRRHLESLSSDIETLGFAGFFGVPIQHLGLGEAQPTAQLPVLLQPQYQVSEGTGDQQASLVQIEQRRTDRRCWRKAWRDFQTSALSSFGFIESTGLLSGLKLLAQTWTWPLLQIDPKLDGLTKDCQPLPPELHTTHVCGSPRSVLNLKEQTDLAERILRNLGLTQNFARLVVLCGHHSQTNNNPLAAGLDCGACGGHSGAPNARWLALLLNQTEIRTRLQERGLSIPADTHFMAAVHNTTTDQIEFFDVAHTPLVHRADLDTLQGLCRAASRLTAQERVPDLSANDTKQLMRRARDWSEVRPEWGLAGNAAFIVGPRSLTRHCNLSGTAFLHSYDADQDTDGSILETIMTAPMIVANWINMQYYASTVDNEHFGSGHKTLHNVVGRFGILSGNAGDLQTGLPWQSLHTGSDLRHQPLRLQVVIAATRGAIERIYRKHDIVFNLVNNEWLHIVAIEDGQYYRLSSDCQWVALSA